MRYFLLDKVVEFKLGEMAQGVKAISLSEPFIHDHFPGYPIMPGALIVEGLAQLSGFLLEMTLNQGDSAVKRALFIQVDKMKFLNKSAPGELLTYEVRVKSIMDDFARLTVEARVGSEVRAQGTLTFQMVEMGSDAINKHRVELYQVWTRGMENCPTIR
jgi:3-hydroxyacyl-[acyl-carrier-protein] dehydratase